MIITGTRENDYGITPEFFNEVYDKNEGFNREASRNSRTVESLDEAMLRGGQMLLEEDPELVEMLLFDKEVICD